MRQCCQFYVDGQWVDPAEPAGLLGGDPPRPASPRLRSPNIRDVENPATEQVAGKVALGSAADVDSAVTAARRAFA
ncbi:MAG: hypothetical protein ACRDTV_01510, partial [Mycobacterium sp.]